MSLQSRKVYRIRLVRTTDIVRTEEAWIELPSEIGVENIEKILHTLPIDEIISNRASEQESPVSQSYRYDVQDLDSEAPVWGGYL